MDTVEIELKSREAKGTRASRRYRGQGLLPINLYSGKGQQYEMLANYKDFVRLAEKSFTSQVFVLKSDQAAINGTKAVVKEIQKEYIKNKLLHVDLYQLNDQKQVRVDVPLNVVGEAPGVKVEGGVLVQSARHILVSCLPDKIPTRLDVDISGLNVGKRIKTGDLVLPEGVTLRSDPMVMVVGVITGRAAVEATTTTTETAPAADASKDGKAASDKPAADKAAGKK